MFALVPVFLVFAVIPFGPPVVLSKLGQVLARTDQVALVSVRNPSEVECLRELPHFVLIGVAAPQAVRFEREVRRGREPAPATKRCAACGIGCSRRYGS